MKIEGDFNLVNFFLVPFIFKRIFFFSELTLLLLMIMPDNSAKMPGSSHGQGEYTQQRPTHLEEGCRDFKKTELGSCF